MNAYTLYYCKGNIPITFVFSAPGNEEVISGRPVSGKTGVNLDRALSYLNQLAPNMFPSIHRYDYRITNAFIHPLAKNIGTGRTEASRSEILELENIRRFEQEIQGCTHIILCGDKAQYLAATLVCKTSSIIYATHIGNRGLNLKFKLSIDWDKNSSSDRRQERIRLWASDVINNINLLSV